MLADTAPVEWSSVPWAVDYGQEMPIDSADKIWAPWERFETPDGEPFWVRLTSREVRWTAPSVVDVEEPTGLGPPQPCPPEGETTPIDPEIEALPVDHEADLWAQMTSAEGG